jgi:hypothetical protein
MYWWDRAAEILTRKGTRLQLEGFFKGFVASFAVVCFDAGRGGIHEPAQLTPPPRQNVSCFP